MWGGKIVKPKVDFATVYVEKKDELMKLLLKAIEKCGGKAIFCTLVGYSLTSLNEWLNLRSVRKAPVVAFFKVAQLLDLDIWKILDGVKLFGKTSRDYLVYREKYQEIENLLIWIESEGTIQIDRRYIQIRQGKEGIGALYTLKEKFERIFGLERHLSIIEDQNDQYKLCIYNSPLRQILVLRYGLQLGYKVYADAPANLFRFGNRKEGLEKLARHFETEGCVSFKVNYHKIKPIFSIASRNKDKVKNLVELICNLGWKAKQYQWKHLGIDMFTACVYRKYEIIDLCEAIRPFLWHKGKLDAIENILSMVSHE